MADENKALVDPSEPTGIDRARLQQGAAEFLGEVAVSVFGERSRGLQKLLLKWGQGAQHDVYFQRPVWIGFDVLMRLVLDTLADKIPEMMQPQGWAVVFQQPVDVGAQILEEIKLDLEGLAGWGASISNCEGYLVATRQHIRHLREQDQTDVQAAQRNRAAVIQSLREFDNGLVRLVRGRDDHMKRKRRKR